MALVIDSEEASALGHTGTPSPLTWSFTNTAGTLLLVGCNASVSTAAGTPGGELGTVTAVTYNTVGLTRLVRVRYGGSSTLATETSIWYLKSPATGSNTVSVTATLTSDGTTHDIIAGAISYTGEDATTYLGTGVTASGTGTTGTVDVTGTTSGNLVFGVISAGTTAGTASSPSSFTWIKDVSGNTSGDNAGGLKRTAPGGTATVAATFTSDSWGIVAAEILASSGSAVIPPGLGPVVQMQQEFHLDSALMR